MVKAQNTYMDNIAHNNQLRTEVNIWRREILFLKQANDSIRTDIARLNEQNRALEVAMKENRMKRQRCEDDQDAVRAMMEMEEETLRERWDAMDEGPEGLQMTLPEMSEVDVDRAGTMTKTSEDKVRSCSRFACPPKVAMPRMLFAARTPHLTSPLSLCVDLHRCVCVCVCVYVCVCVCVCVVLVLRRAFPRNVSVPRCEPT